MAGGIFISYRREDAKHAAGRLVDRLVAAVGRDKLFMDVDNIEPGLDFVKVLNEQVGRCDVLLALIGPQWLEARDMSGRRRLDNPGDFVRIEIEAALARDVRVVPVLLDGAEMPPIEALPPALQPLVRRQAVRISHERFAAEADMLAESMKKALGQQVLVGPDKGSLSIPGRLELRQPGRASHRPSTGGRFADFMYWTFYWALLALPLIWIAMLFGNQPSQWPVIGTLGALFLTLLLALFGLSSLKTGKLGGVGITGWWLATALAIGTLLFCFVVMTQAWWLGDTLPGRLASAFGPGIVVAIVGGSILRRWWQGLPSRR